MNPYYFLIFFVFIGCVKENINRPPRHEIAILNLEPSYDPKVNYYEKWKSCRKKVKKCEYELGGLINACNDEIY